MPVIIQEKWYSREEIQANPKTLYIFGDNNHRVGRGGQAKEARGEPNAVGVVTKNRPSHGEAEDYLNDDFFPQNCKQIIIDFAPAIQHLKTGGTVIFPGDGIGTGLALLSMKAPLTNEFLCTYLKYFFEVGKSYGAN